MCADIEYYVLNRINVQLARKIRIISFFLLCVCARVYGKLVARLHARIDML